MKLAKIRYKTQIIEICAAIFFVVFWEVLASALQSPYLPPFSKVFTAFFTLLIQGDFYGRSLLSHTWASITRVFVGFTIAILVAVPLGLIAGVSDPANAFLKPLIEAIRPIPPIAWIPLTIVVFGIGVRSYAFIIFLGAFFPLFTSTIAGVKRTNLILVDVVKTFGANKTQTISKVILPSASPEIIAGMRIGLGVGWMCIIAAEMIGVRQPLGLGFLIITMHYLGKIPEMVAGMIMIGMVGYILNEIFVIIEKRVFLWREKPQK